MNKINITSAQMDDIKNGELMLEVGCGDEQHQRKEYSVGMDIIDFGQRIVWNLTEGIPLPDNSCKKIYISHTLEHIPIQTVIPTFNEFWRVLIPGGELWAVVPHMKSERAWIPPHIMHWCETTFRFFTGETNPDFTAEMFNSHSTIKREMKFWKLNELVTNERPDIHCKLTPAGK